MQPNLLLLHISTYFKETMAIESRVFVLDNSVNNFKQSIKERPNEHSFAEGMLMDSISTFRDLSQKGGGDNLYHTGFRYMLNYSNLEREIENTLSSLYLLSLSQAYEVFETYLIDIFTELLLLFPMHIVTTNLFSESFIIPREILRNQIKQKIGREKNNKGYLIALRKLSQHYKDNESDNIYNCKMGLWFDILSEVRHDSIHNRQIISNNFFELLKNHEQELYFNKYFDKRNTALETVIHLTKDKFHINLNLLNDFAVFIFKSLSLDNSLNPKYAVVL